MNERKEVFRSGLISLLVIAASVFFLVASASATTVDWTQISGSQYYEPGSSDKKIMEFVLRDGGDYIISNSTVPGDQLYSFQNNVTMFLNQSYDATNGLNGYNDGEDIFRVSRVHTEGNETLNGSVLQNFSSSTLYADGGVEGNGVFDGDEGVSATSEVIIRDNGSEKGVLDPQDFVVSSGGLNVTSFGTYTSDAIRYTDVDDNFRFSGGPEAIIENGGSPSVLEGSDTVLRAGGAGLETFSSNMTFSDEDDDGDYSGGNAIVVQENTFSNVFQSSSSVVSDGSADVVRAENTDLAYYNSTGSSTAFFDNENEPFYLDNSNDGFVNATDRRIGSVEVISYSDSDPTNVELNLTTLEKINSTINRTEDNEVGEELHPVWGNLTGYGSDGSFWVYEFSDHGVSADGTWNPGEGMFNGDQDVLIYDVEGGNGISAGETLLYDEHLNNSNLSAGIGDEFDSTVSGVSNGYRVDADVGFDDTDGDGVYDPVNDSIVVNVSMQSSPGTWSIVQISNRTELPSLGLSGSFNSQGRVKFWNASKTMSSTGDPESDGLFVDMDDNGNVSTGDLRVGEWSTVEDAGPITSNGTDLGADMEPFRDADDVGILDANDDSSYTISGTSSDNREAIITTSDLFLNSTDNVVFSGGAGFVDFPETVQYTDADGSSLYDDGEAIVKNGGGDPDVLENSDEIAVPGSADLYYFNNTVEKYVETGKELGYEQGSNETIIYDNGSTTRVLERGNLSTNIGDYVIVPGKANLRNFSQPPRNESNSGIVYLDKNNTGFYNGGEDILDLTFLVNGSSGNNIVGEKIFNFANTTRHTGDSVFNKGDAIINDTDNNSVYEDVFRGLGIENTFDKTSNTRSYDENLSAGEIVGGDIDLYYDSNDNGIFNPSTDERIGVLNPVDSFTWSESGLEQNITSDKRYFLALDTKQASELAKKTFGMRFAAYQVLNDANSLQLTNCSFDGSCERYLDAHPPEFEKAWTGAKQGGNSGERDKILIEIIESGAGLNNDSFDASDFDLNISEVKVEQATKVQYGSDIRLTLNDSLGTNSRPKVILQGSISDFIGNTRASDDTGTQDGLRPLIEDVRYQDADVDGTIDGLDIEFSENVSYSDFDVSGWDFFNNGIPCLHALAPGNSMSFCSTQPRMMHVTSGDYSSIYSTARYLTETLHLSSGAKIDSSNSNSSKYEIGENLYDVNSSLTGYGGNGTFMVYEFNTSASPADGIWNPNETNGDQDVLVYDKNGNGNISVGDILIYDEKQSNDNITGVNAGDKFRGPNIVLSEEPSKSYRVDTDIGFTGNSTYESADNVTVKIAYNSSSYSSPNSTFVSLAPDSITPGLGKRGTFHSQGEIKFFNTTPSSSNLLEDGIFVDMDESGNITDGDVRLGGWTMRNERKLYMHSLKLPVNSQKGEELNQTVIKFDSEKLGYMSKDAVKEAYIQNSTGKTSVIENIKAVEKSKDSKLLNVSFNTGNRNIWLNDSEKVVLKYYSDYRADITEVVGAAINPSPSGNYTYYGNGTLGQTNTPVVSINASAAEGVTGVSNLSMEPVLNFSVFDNMVADLSGNTLTNASNTTISDDAAPAVTGAATHDDDNDAEIDRISVNFSESLQDSASNYNSAFNLSNGSILNVENPVSDNSELALNVSGVGGTGFVPDLKMYNNTVFDQSGNSADIIQNFNSVQDLAKPVLLHSELNSVKSSSDYSFIQMKFSENVTGTSGEFENITVQNQSGYIRNGGFQINQENDTHSINYTKVLQTGRVPNITAADSIVDDNRNPVALENSEKVPVNTFRREMVKGWNFVSFPIAGKSDPKISELMDESKVNVVWTKVDGEWETFDPEAPQNDFNRVHGGRGYLVNVSEAHTLASNVQITKRSIQSGLSDLGSNVSNGWNLIGSVQEFNQKPMNDTAFASLQATVKPVLGPKYSNGSRTIDLNNPLKDDNANIAGDLEPGRAYWAEMSGVNETEKYREPILGD